MATILIAEDEYLVRIGLRTCIEWEKNGYQLLDDAVDGIDAYEKINTYHPDIVLLDIKMPRLDGLALLDRLRSEGNNVQVIILSCLDDFEHVRQALRYDVVDYMNKLTISPAELLKVLAKVPVQDPDWRDEAQKIATHNETKPWTALKKLLRGQDLSDGELAMLYPRGSVLVIKTQKPDGDSIAPHLLMTITAQQLKTNDTVSIISYDENNAVVVLLQSNVDALAVADQLHRQFRMTLAAKCAIGVSAPYSAVGQLYDTYRAAAEIEDYFYWLRSGEVVNYASVENADSDTEENMLRQIRTAGKSGNLPVIRGSIETITELYLENPKASQSRYCRFLLTALDTIAPEKLSADYYALQTALLQSESFLEAKMALISYLEKNHRKASLDRAEYSHFVRQTLRFIADNPSEIITLAGAAKHINVSESYLSQLFKRETGENFNTYVHHLKIDQAKELLDEGLLIYEVCDRIGFDNANYFAKLFRRYTGFSPNEYKKQRRDK